MSRLIRSLPTGSPERSLHRHGLRRHAWLLAAVVVTALSLLVVFTPTARAGQGEQPVPPQVAAKAGSPGQVYSGGLVVDSGQTIDEDVVVYQGDVTVKRQGTIDGNLTVYSGDVTVEEGGSVQGDITSLSGNVTVNGAVDGSISAMSGDIEIGDAATVDGDVSVMSGNIKQRAGASVGGSVLHGNEIKLPVPPLLGALPWLPAPFQPATPAVSENRLVERPWGLAGRFFGGLLLLGLLVGGAAAATALRPAWVGDVRGVLNQKAALSFAVGLIANVLMLALIAFLFITVCLRPPALLLALAMLGLNALGMAALGAEMGERLGRRVKANWPPVAAAAMGALATLAVVYLLWLMGGCLGFLGGLAGLIVGSIGVGAVLVKVLNLGATPVPAAAGVAAPAAPTASPAAPAPAAPAEAAQPPVSAPAAAAAAPESAVTDVRSGDAAWWKEPQAAEAGGESTAPASAATSDFTTLEGIGPKLAQRLVDANVRTYAELAALSPAALAGILGWSLERVEKSGLLAQAASRAAEEQPAQ